MIPAAIHPNRCGCRAVCRRPGPARADRALDRASRQALVGASIGVTLIQIFALATGNPGVELILGF